MPRTSRHPLVLTVAALALVPLLALLVFQAMPDWFARERGPGFGPISEAEARADVRTAALQFFGGLLLALGAAFTAASVLANREANRIAREGQITERFTRAIEQLAHPTLDVRLGGIYALGRIAQQSAPEHEPVMQVLTAYVRQHAQWTRTGDPRGPSRSDVQAIASVLRLRNPAHRAEESRLDLSATDLREAFLPWADLGNARLTNANLQDARLIGARLERTRLGAVNLAGALMGGAVLRDAHVADGDLRGADLRGADLTGADLRRADLRDAILRGGMESRHPGHRSLLGQLSADFRRRYLELVGRDALLDGTTLDGCRWDERTAWPAGFNPPESRQASR
jgi:hypothetical protein